MTDIVHPPMPVKGYTEQKELTIALVNEGKELEERVLRYIEKVQKHIMECETHAGALRTRFDYLGVGKMSILQGFMWIARSAFNPQRVQLPEDKE